MAMFLLRRQSAERSQQSLYRESHSTFTQSSKQESMETAQATVSTPCCAVLIESLRCYNKDRQRLCLLRTMLFIAVRAASAKTGARSCQTATCLLSISKCRSIDLFHHVKPLNSSRPVVLVLIGNPFLVSLFALNDPFRMADDPAPPIPVPHVSRTIS